MGEKKREDKRDDTCVCISPIRRVHLLNERQEFFASKFFYVQLETQQLNFAMEANKLAKFLRNTTASKLKK